MFSFAVGFLSVLASSLWVPRHFVSSDVWCFAIASDVWCFAMILLMWCFAIASDVLIFRSMGCMGLADVDLGISMW